MADPILGGFQTKYHKNYKQFKDRMQNVFGPELKKAIKKSKIKKGLTFGASLVGGAGIGAAGTHMLVNKDKKDRMHNFGMHGL